MTNLLFSYKIERVFHRISYYYNTDKVEILHRKLKSFKKNILNSIGKTKLYIDKFVKQYKING